MKRTSLLLLLTAIPVIGQNPRLANGKPDFSGVWQAMSSAHYDVERHVARHSLMERDGPHGPLPAVPLLALGAVGSVPGGLGVVDGGTIPYKPAAAPLIDHILDLALPTGYVKQIAVREFLIRLGFVLEGTMRRGFTNDDCVIYGMLREECRWIERTC